MFRRVLISSRYRKIAEYERLATFRSEQHRKAIQTRTIWLGHESVFKFNEERKAIRRTTWLGNMLGKQMNMSKISNTESATTSSSSSSSSTSTRAETANKQLQELSTTINTKLTEKTNWSISDLLAVWTTASLFTLILIGPSVISEMKKSKHSDYYEDDLVVVDYSEDVSILTKQVLDYVHELHQGDEDEEKNVLVNGAADIVSKVLLTDVVQQSLQSLVLRVLQSPEVRESASTFLKSLFHELLQDPNTLHQIITVLHNAIQHPSIKQSLIDLVMDITQDDSVKLSLQKLLERLGKDEDVVYATQTLLVTSAHKTLNDPEILDHTMEFAANIVGDDVVQRTSGEALRNAIRFSVTPDIHTREFTSFSNVINVITSYLRYIIFNFNF